MKWAIELGEHDITFKSRTAIKAQALADFICEMPADKSTLENKSEDGADGPTSDVDSGEVPPSMWTLWVDGASNEDGSGAGVLLVDPNGKKWAYALRFNFKATNNEAEYEALIAGLRIVKFMQVQCINVFSDYQIVVQQVRGTYEARDVNLKKYLTVVRSLVKALGQVTIRQIPRGDNKRADALSKLASSPYSYLITKVLVEVLPCRSTEVKQVQSIEESETTWMTSIWKYFSQGIVPEDKNEARKLRLKIPKYVIQNGIRFKRAYLQPLLRCVGPKKVDYVLREMHERSCGSHTGSRMLAKKIIRWGYYWPTMFQDAPYFVQHCVK